jgi:hypothetical protein
MVNGGGDISAIFSIRQWLGGVMFNLEVGQELEFIEPVSTEDRVISKGTRVRVGAIMAELFEPMVTLVILGGKPPEALTVARHIVTLHCRPVAEHH